MFKVCSTKRADRDSKCKALIKPQRWFQVGLRFIGSQRIQIIFLILIVLTGFMPDAMAQEAKVRGFFTKARDLLIWMGPAVTIGSLFWGGANVLRERPAGKQWAAAAIFLALTILSGVLQDWWG